MRNSKIVALVATAALLVIGAAFTSMAATYNWYQEDGIWHCKDKNGDDYTDAWAKSGSDMYYLDENGEMVTETFLDVDDAYYYVDADGKMVKNDWVKVENLEEDDGDEYYWYYFQSNGKAKKGKDNDGTTKNKPITIGGKKYMFGTDGRMLYGWIDLDDETIDDDYKWTVSEYYAGGEDDGAIRTGWQQVDVLDSREDIEDVTYWFYFGTTGKKTTATDAEKLIVKPINGKKYAFDNTGAMKAEWEQVATASAATAIESYAWFHTVEDGSRLNKGWFRVVPQATVNTTDNDEETPHWYYAVGGGKLAENMVKTIKGKKYAFNENGEMMAGLIVIKLDADNNIEDYEVVDEEGEVSLLQAGNNLGVADGVLYFFGDEESDGSMKTGSITTEVDGDDYTFLFKATGADKYKAQQEWKGNYWYVNGSKLTADADYKYQPFQATDIATGKLADIKISSTTPAKWSDCTAANNYVLLSSSGAIVKNGTKKDADDHKYVVTNYSAVKAD